MGGKAGRSGRKPGWGLTAVEHAARGTYRRSVHGPLPPGVVPVPRRPVGAPRAAGSPAPLAAVVTKPDAVSAALVEADCPDVLSGDGQALWKLLIRQRPTEKVLGPFVAMYVEAMLAWKEATREIQAKGYYGKLGNKVMANPYLRARREAEATMFRVAQLLGWQAPAAPTNGTHAEPPKSRLELFLASRGRR